MSRQRHGGGAATRRPAGRRLRVALSVLGAAALATVAAGCGLTASQESGGAAQSGSSYEFTKKQLKIGFSQVVMNHPFRVANVESIKRHAAEKGVDLIVTDAQGDVNKEIANIESLIARGADAIIVSSLSGKAVYPAYREVAKAKIPLIIFASGVPDDENVPYTSYVATDEVAMGQRAADYIANRMKGKGNLVVIDGVTESTNSQLRTQGFMPQVKQFWPGIKIVAEQSGQWLRLPTQKVMTNILQANPQVDGVFAQNDEMALGAIDALKKAGRDNVFVVGMDAQKEALQAIKSGGPFAMTVKNEWDGSRALDVAIDAVRGKRVEKRVLLDVPMVNAFNIDAHYDPKSTF
jgi:ABC-type sugar transport system substrate-binding protein